MTGAFLLLLLSGVLTAPDVAPIGFAQTQTSRLPRVFVTTSERGEGAELANRRQSVKDLRAALAGKKKTLTLTEDEDRADITIEVMDRTTSVPRVRIGLASPGGPSRAARLRVKLTRGNDDPVEFTNKNTAFEDLRGWESAADDIAKQIEKWIFGHKG
jgi:hypothetical protein